jgi:hypothetical protein
LHSSKALATGENEQNERVVDSALTVMAILSSAKMSAAYVQASSS